MDAMRPQPKERGCGCNDKANLAFKSSVSQIWIPEGSSVRRSEGSLTISPPNGYIYIGETVDGQIARVEGGEPIKVACICRDGIQNGGCIPFYFEVIGNGTGWGCAHDGCTNCSGKVSGGRFQFINGGFVNEAKSSISLVSGVNTSLPLAFKAMFNQLKMEKLLDDFVRDFGNQYDPKYRELDGHIELLNDYSFGLIELYGRVLTIPIPDSVLRSLGEDPKKDATCSCSSAGATCKLEKQSGGIFTAWFCKGDCPGTCTLTVGKVGGVLAPVAMAYQF